MKCHPKQQYCFHLTVAYLQRGKDHQSQIILVSFFNLMVESLSLGVWRSVFMRLGYSSWGLEKLAPFSPPWNGVLRLHSDYWTVWDNATIWTPFLQAQLVVLLEYRYGFWPHPLILYCFLAKAHKVAQGSLKLMFLRLQPSKCWDSILPMSKYIADPQPSVLMERSVCLF